MTGRRRTVHVVPHTHWDREWYLPFQVFRARLVDVIDAVLALLANERYRRFTLDGQAVVLDDYLEVRPERRDELGAQVRAGRLRIGPWYVLADEFLVSPESLVRNLALGRAVCRRLGTPMPVAYTPDSFGHVSQLPLLVRGFGMDAIVFERGVGDEGERLRGEFEWVAADGATSVFAVHLLGTYSSAAALGHLDWEMRDRYDPDRAVRQVRAVLYGTRDMGDEFPAWLRESVERLEGGIDAYATGDALLLLNGSDHLFPQPNVPELLDDLDTAFDDLDFVHADVEEYVRAAQTSAPPLERHRGEFRGSRYQHVLSGVLSARTYLKQANHRAENLLERYAEPLASLAAQAGATDARPLLGTAWRTLLLNHAHDSICGCSVDAVHREMMVRFESVTQLGDDLCRRAVDHLAGQRADPREERREATRLALFNPLPRPHDGVVETTLLLAPGSAATLRVLDADGNELPSQVEAAPSSAPGKARLPREEVRLAFLAPLPPLGVATVRVFSGEGEATAPAGAAPSAEGGAVADPRQARASVLQGRAVLENGALRVEIDEQGAIVLHYLADGSASELALRFEDEADAGDEYDFSAVEGDAPVVADRAAGPPRLLAAGPVRARVALRYRLTMPERLADDRRARVGAIEHDIELELGLDAGAARLDLTATIDNRSRDHRLRLRLASGIRTERVLADGHFHVLERPVAAPAGDGWFQRPTPTNHQRRFVAVVGDGRGLALLNSGLPEYEARATDDGVELAVTMLRCVGWLSRDDLVSRPQGAGPALPTPEAQCLGPARFELAVVPFTGPWWEGALALEADRFTAPPRALAIDGSVDGTVEASLFELDPPLQLSCCKPADADPHTTIVRVWNPSPVGATGRLRPRRPLRDAHLARLDETRESRLEPNPHGLELTLGPAQVVTLELRFRGEEVTPG